MNIITNSYHLRVFIFLALLIVLPDIAFAQDDGTFSGYTDNYTDSDLSIEIISMIFGSVWETMLQGGGITVDADGTGGLLGAISLVLNVAALMMTAFFVMFTTFTSVINTAAEGVAMGKKYNSFWVPARIVLTIIMMMPVAGGYSLAQSGVMLVAKAGGGIGNSVLSAGVDYIYSDSFSEVGASGAPKGAKLAEALLLSETCGIAFSKAVRGNSMIASVSDKNNSIYDQVYTGGGYGYTTKGTGSKDDPRKNLNVHELYYKPAMVNRSFKAGVCGQYKLSDDGLNAFVNILDGRYEGKSSNSDNLSSIASELNSAKWVAFLDLKEQMEKTANDIYDPETEPSWSEYTDAIKTYNDAVNEAVQNFYETMINNITPAVTQEGGRKDLTGSPFEATAEMIKEQGWMFAGAYHWTMASFLNAIESLLSQSIEITGPDILRFSEKLSKGRMKAFGNTLQSSQDFLEGNGVDTELASDLMLATPSSGDDAEKGFARAIASSGAAGVANFVVYRLTSNGDPILSGQSIGRKVVFTSVALYTAYALLKAVADGAGGGPVKLIPFVGNGAAAIQSLLSSFLGFVSMIAMGLLAVGLVLAYWLPAIPMVMWIVAIAGYLTFLIEAVFGTIVWIPAHAIPEGDGFTGQHARTGYMMLLGLFMRPALMVVGLFAGMKVMQAVGVLIGKTFPVMLSDANITSALDIIGFLASVCVLMMLLVVTADRSYSLVHSLPDNILRWISGNAQTLGTQDDANRTRIMMGGVMGRFERGVSGGMGNSASKGKQQEASSATSPGGGTSSSQTNNRNNSLLS